MWKRGGFTARWNAAHNLFACQQANHHRHGGAANNQIALCHLFDQGFIFINKNIGLVFCKHPLVFGYALAGMWVQYKGRGFLWQGFDVLQEINQGLLLEWLAHIEDTDPTLSPIR